MQCEISNWKKNIYIYNIQNILLIGTINDGNFRHYIVLMGKALFCPLHILSHKLLLTSLHFPGHDQPNTI